MRLISRLRGRCYCAFCKSPRNVYVKKHVDLTNVLGAAFLSMTAAYAYFGQPDPRGVGIFCVVILGAEIFVYLRWRLALVCNLCGFDPVLYKRSPELASNKVKEFFREKRENAEFHLTRSPLLDLQKQHKERERRETEMKIIEARMLAKRPKSNSLTPPKSM